MRKPTMFIVGLAAAGLLGGGILTAANGVYAQSESSSLIERIVSRFNLNENEVEQVFQEFKDEREAERSAELSERLQEKVDDGEITAEQKTAIEEKLASLRAEREAEREELEQWAEENNIEHKYLFRLGPHGGDWDDEEDLTAEQKDLIDNKLNELEETSEARHKALESWAEELGIDLEELMPFHGHGLKKSIHFKF